MTPCDNPKDVRLATPKELAGPHYEEMMLSKERAIECLCTPDCKIRLGAILVCGFHWGLASDLRVLAACRELIADSSADDPVRIAALGAFSCALSGTKDRAASAFIAQVVLDARNSQELRLNAYYDLRLIQFGIDDTSYDGFWRSTIHTVKECLRLMPSRFDETSVRTVLCPQPGFPSDFWESTDEIDWDFVKSVAAAMPE